MDKKKNKKIIKPDFTSSSTIEDFGNGHDPLFWTGQLLEELARYTAGKHALTMVEAIYDYYSIDRDDVDEDELANILGEEMFQELMTDAFMCHLFFDFLPTAQDETIAESFLRSNKRIHPLKRAYVEQALKSYPSVYQLRQREQGVAHIHDIFLDEERTIEASHLDRYPLKAIFMARFMEVDGRLVPLSLSQPVSPLHMPSLRSGLLASYEEELKICREEGIMTPQPLSDFLSRNEGAILDLMEEVSQKEGSPETYYAADYLINNMDEVRRYLATLEATSPHAFYLPISYDGLEGFAILGVDEQERQLIVECVEGNDLEEAMDMIEEALNDHIEFDGDREFDDEEDLRFLDAEHIVSAPAGFLDDFPQGPLDFLDGMSIVEAHRKGSHGDMLEAVRDAVIFSHEMLRLYGEEHTSVAEIEERYQALLSGE